MPVRRAPSAHGGRRSALPEPVVSDDGPHQLVDRQGQHAKEQVAGHLRVPADPDMPSAVRVFQGGVHPPGAGAPPLADADVGTVVREELPEPSGGTWASRVSIAMPWEEHKVNKTDRQPSPNTECGHALVKGISLSRNLALTRSLQPGRADTLWPGSDQG